MTAMAPLTVDPIEEALRKERIDIAAILYVEINKHNEAAEEMEMDGDPDQEAAMHRSDASMLRGLVDRILSRTPAVAEPAAEPKF